MMQTDQFPPQVTRGEQLKAGWPVVSQVDWRSEFQALLADTELEQVFREFKVT